MRIDGGFRRAEVAGRIAADAAGDAAPPSPEVAPPPAAATHTATLVRGNTL